jgi:hypothetical protein
VVDLSATGILARYAVSYLSHFVMCIKILPHPSDFSSNHAIQHSGFLLTTPLNLFLSWQVINSYHNLSILPGFTRVKNTGKTKQKPSQTFIFDMNMGCPASRCSNFTSGKTPQYPSDGRLEVSLIFTNYLCVVSL